MQTLLPRILTEEFGIPLHLLQHYVLYSILVGHPLINILAHPKMLPHENRGHRNDTPLTHSMVPMKAISYFSIGIIRNLRQSRFVSIIQVNKYLARQVRRMLIPQLIANKNDPLRAAVENWVVTTIRLLFYLNCAGSFYIYIIMPSEIRCELKKIFFQQNTIDP
ncbi:unnamed protein product [Rotaria socialis]|uniref:Uncharacterized protein n=2 Tax=Rotaria socialis TaxID=392032 RepID=A0A820F2S7_9BILA|nr:unnamed protein product [Rotaria socialis]CAF4255031.1 unnamed protein product [Rotaria socialis]CAF4279725.1 unnamed protein product [Rotaria socialis]